jgi:hypothetical protein
VLQPNVHSGSGFLPHTSHCHLGILPALPVAPLSHPCIQFPVHARPVTLVFPRYDCRLPPASLDEFLLGQAARRPGFSKVILAAAQGGLRTRIPCKGDTPRHHLCPLALLHRHNPGTIRHHPPATPIMANVTIATINNCSVLRSNYLLLQSMVQTIVGRNRRHLLTSACTAGASANASALRHLPQHGRCLHPAKAPPTASMAGVPSRRINIDATGGVTASPLAIHLLFRSPRALSGWKIRIYPRLSRNAWTRAGGPHPTAPRRSRFLNHAVGPSGRGDAPPAWAFPPSN